MARNTQIPSCCKVSCCLRHRIGECSGVREAYCWSLILMTAAIISSRDANAGNSMHCLVLPASDVDFAVTRLEQARLLQLHLPSYAMAFSVCVSLGADTDGRRLYNFGCPGTPGKAGGWAKDRDMSNRNNLSSFPCGLPGTRRR